MGEPVGDHLQHRGIPHQAAVAAVDLDVLDHRMVLALHAGLPGDDAVAAAVDGRGRHLGRGQEARLEVLVQHRQRAVDPAVEQADVGLRRLAGDRRADRDDLPDGQRDALGDLARVDAAQAPAHQRDRLRLVGDQRLDVGGEGVEPAVDVPHRPGVQAAAPVARRVAEAVAEAHQRRDRLRVGRQAGEHDDGMAVARRMTAAVHQAATGVFHRGTQRLDAEQRPGGRRDERRRDGQRAGTDGNLFHDVGAGHASGTGGSA